MRKFLFPATFLLLLSLAASAATPDSLLLVAQLKKGNITDLNGFLASHPGVATQLSPTGTPPLVTAISLKCQPAVVSALIAAGADPNQANKRGVTPLQLALGSQNIALVELLLANKANPNETGNKGRTPLHNALLGKDKAVAIQLIDMLIRAGAKPDVPDQKGRTPLCQAVFSSSKDDTVAASLVRVLVAGGAKPDQKVLMGTEMIALVDVAKNLKMPQTQAALTK